jgi:hypothetical protein
MSNLPYNWRVISNDGTNIIAWNRVTNENFNGTIANFNAILLAAQPDTDPDFVDLSLLATALQPPSLNPIYEHLALLSSPQPNQGAGTYLQTGASVAWVSGHTYRVGASSYFIAGVECSSEEQEITLTNSDPDYPRFDALVLDANGDLSAVPGAPSATPAAPNVDPETYFTVTIALVPANATDAPITQIAVYPGWTITSSAASVVVDSISNPRSAPECIEGTDVASGAYVQPVAVSPIDPTSLNSVVFYIRVKAAWPSTKSLRIIAYLNTSRRGSTITIPNGAYGFNSQLIDTYQQIVIPISVFKITAGQLIDRFRLSTTGSGANVGFYVDDWSLQSGIQLDPEADPLFASVWLATVAYARNKIVVKDGTTYIALQQSLGQDPATQGAYWAPISANLSNLQGAIIGGYCNAFADTVSGLLTKADHSGKWLLTSGNVTIPGDVGFNCVLIAGGAHTITFNGTASVMEAGDLVNLFVQSAAVIHGTPVKAADKLVFA